MNCILLDSTRTRVVSFLAAFLAGGTLGCSDPLGPGGETSSDPSDGSADDGTGSGGNPGGTGSAGQFGRIHYSDLTYLGAVKAPDQSVFSYAEGQLAWHPSRNQLVAVGKQWAMFDVPAPVVSPTENAADLRWALMSGAAFDPTSAVRPGLQPAGSLGGIVWHRGRIWMGFYEFYNVAARDNLGLASLDENYGDARGAWRVGPSGVNSPLKNTFHANKTHSDVMVLPQDWADAYVPGADMAGGRTRGAGAFGGGAGPALYAFQSDATKPAGSDFGGVALMAYGERNNRWPGYRNADQYHQIWIWKGDRHAVIVGARKGTGPDVYGPGPTCNPAKGWQSGPYEPRMSFIDVDDLGEVAQGNKMPWEIRPYEEVMPTEMWNEPTDPSYDPGCKTDWFVGWAWDHERSLLYASQPKAFWKGQGNRMIVHVWRVN